MTQPVVEGEILKEYTPDETPVATFWRQATEGTHYWRLLIPARRLPARINSLKYQDTLAEDCLERQEGVAIWQFLGDLDRTKFAARIQASGVRSLMEVDDNYLVPPPRVPNMKSGWQTTVRKSFGRGETGYSHQAHRKILMGVDGVIVSTDEIADRYAGYVTGEIHVCPNSVELDDWEPVEHGHTERRVTVGYAGSDSHYYDLFLVERALDYASRHASLVKMGAHGNNWRWPHEIFPWTDDLAQYRRNLQGIDIGLCPVKRSDWHDCKSDIKAMEYIMAGALPIVQADSPCYREWADIVPAASTEKQWEKSVKEVLSWSPEERKLAWQIAYDYLLENKTIDRHLHKWRKAIEA